MPLIECLAGPTETTVGGTGYNFERDREGRFVAEVHDLRHVMCLLSVVHYRQVEELPSVAVPIPATAKPAKQPKPAKQATQANDTPAVGFGIINPAPTPPQPESASETDDGANGEAGEQDAPEGEASGDAPGDASDDGADGSNGSDGGADQTDDSAGSDEQGNADDEEPANETPPADQSPAEPIVLPTAAPKQKIRRRGRGR